MNNPMVEFKEVTKVYQRGNEQVRALDGVNLNVQEGDFLAVVGPSGSGKTTLLNLMGCLDKATSGIIQIKGKDTSKQTEKQLTEIRKRTVGFVFQQFFLIPTLTALENVLVPTLFLKGNDDKYKIAKELLDLVELSKRANHLPSQLSGGEMQRVAIARALINNPSLLLADEPTGNLDSKQAQKIIDILKELNNKGRTIIMVTHNLDLAKHCHTLVPLRDGAIVSK